jgi:hypothetical protein
MVQDLIRDSLMNYLGLTQTLNTPSPCRGRAGEGVENAAHLKPHPHPNLPPARGRNRFSSLCEFHVNMASLGSSYNSHLSC